MVLNSKSPPSNSLLLLLISYLRLLDKLPTAAIIKTPIKIEIITILNSLNNAVAKKYFIKESVDYDKRVKIYKLSKNFQQTIIEWINELKRVTNEIN